MAALEIIGSALWCESVTFEQRRGAESKTGNFFVSLFALFSFTGWLVVLNCFVFSFSFYALEQALSLEEEWLSLSFCVVYKQQTFLSSFLVSECWFVNLF